MTNAKKFKTAEERKEAFYKFCNGKDCKTCQLENLGDCKFKWLELEAVDDGAFILHRTISQKDIVATEKVLVDNGIDEDKASTVLQAIGYTLLDVELY